MKRFGKLFIALALAFAMVFSMAACKQTDTGGGNDGGDNGGTVEDTTTIGDMLQTGLTKLYAADQFTLTLKQNLDNGEKISEEIVLKRKDADYAMTMFAGEGDDRVLASETIVKDGISYDRMGDVYLPSAVDAFDTSIFNDIQDNVKWIADMIPNTLEKTDDSYTAKIVADVKGIFDGFVAKLTEWKDYAFKDAVLDLRYGKDHTETMADFEAEVAEMFSADISVKSFIEDYVDTWLTAVAGEPMTVKAIAEAVCVQAGYTAEDLYEILQASEAGAQIAAPGKTDTPYTYAMNLFGLVKASAIVDSMDGEGAFENIGESILLLVNGEIEAGVAVSVTDVYDMLIAQTIGSILEIPAEMLTYETLSSIELTKGTINAAVTTDKEYALRSVMLAFELAVKDGVNMSADITLTVDTASAVAIAAPTEKVLLSLQSPSVILPIKVTAQEFEILAGTDDIEYTYSIIYGIMSADGYERYTSVQLDQTDAFSFADNKFIISEAFMLSVDEFFANEVEAVAMDETLFYSYEYLLMMMRRSEDSMVQIRISVQYDGMTAEEISLQFGTLREYLELIEALRGDMAA